MHETNPPLNHDDTMPFAAADYRRMQSALPGVDALYRLMRAAIETTLPDGVAVLILGAGGGREIEALSESRLNFQMTAVDPSEPMLNLARSYAKQYQVEDRVDFVHGLIDDVPLSDQQPAAAYAAATSMLVMHFIDDDGSKRAYLRAIRRRLRPGAVLVLADVCFESAEEFTALQPLFLQHAELVGLPEQQARLAPEMIAQLPVIGPTRTLRLLSEAGFASARPLFQTLWYRAWWCHAA